MIEPLRVGQEVKVSSHPANFFGVIMSEEEMALQPVHDGRVAITEMVGAHTGKAQCLEVLEVGDGVRCAVTQLVSD